MTRTSLQERFAWRDVIDEGEYCRGWGWLQSCMLGEGKVEIDCLQMPTNTLARGMKLHISRAYDVTLIDYIDTGFVLHSYMARLTFEGVLTRLWHVESTPVHMVALELLNGLSKDGFPRLLTQLVDNQQRRRRGQFKH